MYTFRNATISDLEKIVKHRGSVEGGNAYFERPVRYYEWKYFKNPIGKSIVKIAESEKGELVGLVSANPKRFIGNNKVIKGLEWGDFFTHTNHQHKGIFSRLCQEIMEDIKDQDICFSYIRPNSNSYPIVTSKLGFDDLDKLEERFYFIDAKKLLKRRIKGSLLVFAGSILHILLRLLHKQPGKTDSSIRVIEKNDFQDLELSDSRFTSSENSGFMMVKDRDYIFWRFFSTPIPMKCFARIDGSKITDYLVVAFDKLGGVYLVDCTAGSEDSCTKLMDAMLNDIIDQRKKYVTTCLRSVVQQNDIFSKTIKRYRFKKIGKNLHFVKKVHKTDSDLFLNDWQFRLADIDGV